MREMKIEVVIRIIHTDKASHLSEYLRMKFHPGRGLEGEFRPSSRKKSLEKREASPSLLYTRSQPGRAVKEQCVWSMGIQRDCQQGFKRERLKSFFIGIGGNG